MQRTHSLGHWVRRQRKALDLTQAALAGQVGCATITIRKIEADERRPSRQMAARLAKCLGLSPEDQARFIAVSQEEQPVDTIELPRASLAGNRLRPPEWLERVSEAPLSEATFVGRERELAFLRAHLKKALDGDGRVVLVSGEAGRGKTTLLAEFIRQAQEVHPDLIAVQGNCTAAAGLGDPYLPFRDIIVSLAGDLELRWQAGMLSAEQARRLWEFAPEVARMVLAVGRQLVGPFLPARSLQRWLESPLAEMADDTASSSERKLTRLAEQFTAVILALSRQRPLLLLIDDLQWADMASVGLLFHLGRRLSGSRILIAGAFRRSEIAAGTRSRPDEPLQQAILEFQRLFGEIELDLEQFHPQEARGLSDALLNCQANRLDESFRVRLFWQTRGHPLFVLELLQEMKARGFLVRDSQGMWVEGQGIDWESLPSRVAAVIEQRLTRLDRQERYLLEVASVQGERFTAEVVAAVSGLEGEQVFRLLARELARRHELIWERGEFQVDNRRLARYQFRHVLFQQYLYNSLGEAERRRLHSHVAVELNRLHQDNLVPVLAQLAHHFAEAGQPEPAVRYLLEAGDRARTLYAHQEAISHYRRAVEILDERGDLEQKARTLMKLGLTYQIAFDYQYAQRCFDEAFALWRRAPSPAEAGRQQLISGSPVSGPPPAARTLRLLWLDPPSLDPTMGGYNMTAPVATQLFSGLVTYGPGSDLWPDVARSWEIEDSGRHYLFHLRDDVFWSDGRPVTAYDFEFTYRRALDPATAAPVAGQLLSTLKGAGAFTADRQANADQLGVRALDAHTLAFDLAQPTSYFIHNLAYYVLLPVPQHVVTAAGAEWATPERIVTNGPFRLRGWEPGDFMLLERYPGYHGSFSGNLEQVHLTLGRHPGIQGELYEASQLDVVSNWYASTAEIDRLRQRFPDEYERRPFFLTIYFFMDVSRPPFDDRRVRRALTMAIDRQALAQVHLNGYVEPATGGYVPPGMPGHVPGCALPFDGQRARQLLAEAGFPGGRGFPETSLLARESRGTSAAFLQASWKEILNIDITPKLVAPLAPVPWDEFNLVIGGWIADYPDPDNFLRVDVELTVPAWRDDGFRHLLEQATQIIDQDERLRLYRQAETILAQEAPLVPLYYESLLLLLKPWLRRYPTAAVKYPGFWKDVILDPHTDTERLPERLIF